MNAEEMKRHLVMSHFRQEALTKFGNSDQCSICFEVLALPKESFRKQYVLQHMVAHLPMLVRPEDKDVLGVGDESGEDLSDLIDTIDCEPELPKDMDMKVETGSDHGNMDIKVETGSGDVELDSSKQKNSSNFKSAWQDCLQLVRQEFPHCAMCQIGFHSLSNFSEHVFVTHYGIEALKLFGAGEICSVCNEFTLPEGSPSYRNRRAKRHMKVHFELYVPDKIKKLFCAAVKHDFSPNRKTTNYISDCNQLLKKKYPECQACQTGFLAITALKDHLFLFHYGYKALELFGTGEVCEICKKCSLPEAMPGYKRKFIKRHMKQNHAELMLTEEWQNLFKGATLLETKDTNLVSVRHDKSQVVHHKLQEESPNTTSESKNIVISPYLQDCITYFKDKYQKCQACQCGHESLSALKLHITIVHYSGTALELFGGGNDCPVCDKTIVPTVSEIVDSSVSNKEQLIKEHMSHHLEKFVVGQAKGILQKATEDLPQQQIYITTNVSYLHDCLMYFKDKYPECQACQCGHKSLASLKLHLATAHYGGTAVELFGGGNACPLCESKIDDSASVPIRERCIQEHMSHHLEKFVVGKAKSFLQKATEAQAQQPKGILTKVSNDQIVPCVEKVAEKKSSVHVKAEKPEMPLPESSQVSHLQDREKVHKESSKAEAPILRTRLQRKVKVEPCKTSKSQTENVQVEMKKMERMPKNLWEECQEYFRNKYPSCKMCRAGHRTLCRLKRHITAIHYASFATSLFGEGVMCNFCKKMSIPLDLQGFVRRHLIKNHMSVHLELFIQDEKARTLLRSCKKNISKHVVSTKSLKPTLTALSIKSEVNTEENAPKINLESKMPIFDDSNKSEAKEPKKLGKSLGNVKKVRKRSGRSIHLTGETRNFFTKTFPNCATCDRGTYQSPYNLAEHLLLIHYYKDIPGYFDKTNYRCKLCNEEFMDPTRASKGISRHRCIARHYLKAHRNVIIENIACKIARECLQRAFKEGQTYTYVMSSATKDSKGKTCAAQQPFLDEKTKRPLFHSAKMGLITSFGDLITKRPRKRRCLRCDGSWRHLDRQTKGSNGPEEDSTNIMALICEDYEEKAFWAD